MTDTETAAPEPAVPAPPGTIRKRSGAQLALDQATEDCAAFAKLWERLERVRVAFEGKAAPGVGQPPAQLDPRPTSHLEGLAFIHGCNVEVRGRMEVAIGRFEELLDCGPAGPGEGRQG
jgi:hypothetical protein